MDPIADPIITEINATIMKIQKAWNDNTAADAILIIDLFDRAIKTARIDFTKVRQQIREAIKSKFNNIYDTVSTHTTKISTTVIIDLIKIWKDLQDLHYVYNGTCYVYSGSSPSIHENSDFYKYIKALPPVAAFMNTLQNEFPSATIEFDLEFYGNCRVMTFTIDYDCGDLLDKLPKVLLTN